VVPDSVEKVEWLSSRNQVIIGEDFDPVDFCRGGEEIPIVLGTKTEADSLDR
jgi:hypothetical protein